MKQEILAVIFDMDGVIFDSERCVYKGWLEIAEKYNFQWDDETYWKCIGVNATASEQIFKDHYGEDFPYTTYKEEQRGNYHRKYDGGRLPLKPGVVEILTYLKSKNIPIAIASSTRTETVMSEIKDANLLQFFDIIIGGDQVSKSKPNPDIFIEAARQLGVAAEKCMVIEDSYNGIRAAKAANMLPIMVPDMLVANEEMHEKAWAICDELTEIISLGCFE